MLYQLHPNIYNLLSKYEVDGGMNGGTNEKPTNLQEECSMGEGILAHNGHEMNFPDPMIDFRDLVTTFKATNKIDQVETTTHAPDGTHRNSNMGVQMRTNMRLIVLLLMRLML